MKQIIAYSTLLLNFLLTAAFYPLMKDLLDQSSSVFLGCLVILCGCLPAGCLLLIIAGRKHPLPRHLFLQSGLIGICLGLLLIVLVQSLSDMSASEAAFFPCANGIIAALWAWRQIHRSTWLAASITILGMLFLILFNGAPDLTHWRGDLLALISTVLYVVYFFLLERLELKTAHAAQQAIGWQFLSMSSVALFVLLVFGEVPRHLALFGSDGLRILGVSGATIVIPVILFPFLARQIDAIAISFVSILEPLIAVTFSWLFLHERLSWLGSFGAFLVLVGVLIQTISYWRQGIDNERLDRTNISLS